MSDTAQNLNSNVNDIWSLPDSSTQAPQANTSPQNPNNDLIQMPVQKPLGGSFGKPGLAGGGEGGIGWESTNTVREEQSHDERLPSVEKIRSPEVGEKLKPAETLKPKEEKIKESQVVQPEEISAKKRVVDKRTGNVKTHRVAERADGITKTADIKEQEFIEGVEQVHSII